MNEAELAMKAYLDGENSDEEHNGEDSSVEDDGNTDWKSIKARLQTAGRSRHQINPVEHKVRFPCYLLLISRFPPLCRTGILTSKACFPSLA